MDLQYLRRLVNIFDDSKAELLEIEEEGIKLKISKNLNSENHSSNTGTIIQLSPQGYSPAPYPIPNTVAPAPVNYAPAPTSAPAPAVAAPVEVVTPVSNLYEIKSPIVGTYYKAPSPDSAPFVEVGSRISIGSTLCIVEAMKLMNEIESDVNGVVEKVLLDNGAPVEFNQVLFVIRLD